jgi:hypothetical protein
VRPARPAGIGCASGTTSSNKSVLSPNSSAASGVGMLPTFIVIGAMKAGTTSLHGYLNQHPDVFMSDPKELNFFSAQHNWGKGLSWYEAHFAGASGAVAIGESSPGYTMFPFFPGIPERIAAVLPNIRLIYVVRDPIERMLSEYVHARARGFETRPVNQALLEGSRYLLLSSYALQLEQYQRHFAPEDILLVSSDDLRHRRSETLSRVLAHIGVGSGLETIDAAHEMHSSARKRAARVNSYPVNRVTQQYARRLPVRGRAMVERVTSRPFREDELRIDDDVSARLREMLRTDISRLASYLPDAAQWLA